MIMVMMMMTMIGGDLDIIIYLLTLDVPLKQTVIITLIVII